MPEATPSISAPSSARKSRTKKNGGAFDRLPAETAIAAAEKEDEATLAALDARGFILGAHETAAEFAERLRALRTNVRTLENALKTDGVYTLDKLRFEARERIPPGPFVQACDVTERLYQFRVDWVPGFYLTQSLGFLFGGCALSSYPDFFALFIIRKAFATREKWLIYNRTELLAHELCHIARIALQSRRFEEMHAYRTAASPFRRGVGGMFHTPLDGYFLLGATFLLLAAQIGKTFAIPALPVWPFWGLVVGVIAYFVLRHTRDLRIFHRAEKILAARFGENAAAVLFRCSDEETAAVAALPDAGALDDWLDFRFRTSLRWRVIRRRFGTAENGAEQLRPSR